MVTVTTTRSSSLLTGILLGSSVTLVITYVYRRHCHDKSKASSDRPLPSRPAHPSPPPPALPPSLRAEQLSRSSLYFGDANMTKLSRDSRICIVGVGGVGSHVAMSLARAGVGPLLRLVDFDQVSLSSLNRHACATLSHVGTPKVICVRDAIRQLCHDDYLTVETRPEMFAAASAERLMELPDDEHWDMVVDAIDDVPTKAELIQYCLRHKIPVVSCMGAGGKADVTRLHISDLQSASKDPLATKLRQSLKRLLAKDKSIVTDDDDTAATSYLQDMDQLSILYSSEKTVVKLAALTPQQQAAPHTFGAMDHMRVRVVPVLGTMPAIMGLSLAALCLTRLGNMPLQPVPGERVGRSVRHKVLQHLKTREEKIQQRVLQEAGMEQTLTESPGSNGDHDENDDEDDTPGCVVNGTWIGRVQVDMDDIDYLFEVWRNRCAVTGARLGAVLSLVRWNLDRPSTTDNLVLMSAKALKQFDRPGGKSTIPEALRKVIEERLATCRCD